jgi:hypothetical protein
MPDHRFEEEHRRFRETLRRRHEEIGAARQHFMDVTRRAQEAMEEAAKALRDRLAAAGYPPPRARPILPGKRPDNRRRRDRGERDIGGVPVEPDRPRNLSGGAAAAVPEAEE